MSFKMFARGTSTGLVGLLVVGMSMGVFSTGCASAPSDDGGTGSVRGSGGANRSGGSGGGAGGSAGSSGPAPAGDQYFAAALYLADQRWGSTGSVNYKQEADNIATAFMHNTASGGNCTIFNQAQNQVVFFPLGNSCNITDPSYHLPGFYEMFSL